MKALSGHFVVKMQISNAMLLEMISIVNIILSMTSHDITATCRAVRAAEKSLCVVTLYGVISSYVMVIMTCWAKHKECSVLV